MQQLHHGDPICSCQGRQRQHTDLAVSPSPDLVSGISYLQLCVYHRHLDSFKASWRQYFFTRPTRQDSARSWLLSCALQIFLLTYLQSLKNQDLFTINSMGLSSLMSTYWTPEKAILHIVLHYGRSGSSNLELETCGTVFFKFWFSFSSVFEKTWIQFGMSLVRFGSKNAVQFEYYSYLLLM